MKKTKQGKPKWFNGEIYEKGAKVTNRFGGDSCYLNNVELRNGVKYTNSCYMLFSNIYISGYKC